MENTPQLQTNISDLLRSRSMGAKLIVVCTLALLMMIPAFIVNGLVSERVQRAEEVKREIGSYLGGKQTFLGPVLIVPYSATEYVNSDRAGKIIHGFYFASPLLASSQVIARTEERRRSLFKVPIYQAELRMNSEFDLAAAPSSLPDNAQLEWNQAEILVGVSDARGASSDATITISGKSMALAPAKHSFTGDGGSLGLVLFSVPAGEWAKPSAHFQAEAALHFSGAQRIALLCNGKTTNVQMQADWPNPGFDGGFLPLKREITNRGFTAQWSVPYIARGVPAEGPIGQIQGLSSTALGVNLVEVADPYQSVTRATKFALLFIGMVFLAYFVFEVTTGKRVHPAQYILVGLAQVIFYLLLLSLSERIGFDFGFLVAGTATVLLLSLNAMWIFKSRVQGLRGFGCFGLLYLLIYVMMRLEDNALLVGAVASFTAVAVTMYFTRNIGWYNSLSGDNNTVPPPSRS